ncbi:hypothetical protein BpHYR1_043982 [Brachionus plicatilis]|uniref:C2H2-type domain-containing protein n=1 Tax=Brachionus plicatilis TaxID=10195 RepID=A0A3M7QVM2_BRAPC|nr:hypothetical protein BpHYR1_043982 [Brachionus plicatilis]
MNNKIKLICQYCPKTYVSKAWFDKHLLSCSSKLKILKSFEEESSNSQITGDLLPKFDSLKILHLNKRS